jgi:hypothetical protein
MDRKVVIKNSNKNSNKMDEKRVKIEKSKILNS